MKHSKKLKIFAKKWAAALRSGNYKKGVGALFKEDENSYCCLGVACEILKSWPISTNLHLDGTVTSKLLGSNSPRVGGIWFTNLNDVGIKTQGLDRLNFDEIADLIELKYIHGGLD